MTLQAARAAIRWLAPKHIKMLYARYIGKIPSCQDPLLHSALDGPRNRHHWTGEEHPVNLASTLAARIIKNHPFGNGNKRAGHMAANAFLKVNGYMLHPEGLDAADGGTRAKLEEAHGKVEMEGWNDLDLTRVEGELAEVHTSIVQRADIKDMD